MKIIYPKIFYNEINPDEIFQTTVYILMVSIG